MKQIKNHCYLFRRCSWLEKLFLGVWLLNAVEQFWGGHVMTGLLTLPSILMFLLSMLERQRAEFYRHAWLEIKEPQVFSA